MAEKIADVDAIDLFSAFMKVMYIPGLKPEKEGDPKLVGKTVGVIGAAVWISLFQSFFGRKVLPGVKLMSCCDDFIQYNFLKAHSAGAECPPEFNKEFFAYQAVKLHEIIGVDAVITTCSTMNRSYPVIQEALKKYNVPLVQIDMPMMEKAVLHGGKILVVATYGPTIENTKLLLEETAEKLGKSVSFTGINILPAYDALIEGYVEKHNELIANGIRQAMKEEKIDIIVLAQLSMSVFSLSYPEGEKEFGVPVLTSAECGFNKIKEILLSK